jgi:hypothetical protein
MRLWPDSLAARIAIALLVATLSIVALDLWLAHAEAASQPPHGTPGFAEPPAPMPVLTPARAVVLCADFASVPAEAAPVLAISQRGELVVRRPPPLARGPRAEAPELAALVLPKADLAALDPAQRAAVVDALGRLCGGAAAPQTVRALGVAATREQIEALLRWIR